MAERTAYSLAVNKLLIEDLLRCLVWSNDFPRIWNNRPLHGGGRRFLAAFQCPQQLYHLQASGGSDNLLAADW
jgi:hypothetical protein